jgi:hypothetical protein
VRKDGHDVLSVDRLDDHWRVLVRKQGEGKRSEGR